MEDDRRLPAVETLYREMYGLMVTYAKNALDGNGAAAEEAVQETFRIALSKAGPLVSSGNPRGWLINTLKNVLANIRRERARAGRLLQKAASHAAGSSDGSLPGLTGLISDGDVRLLRRVVLDGCSAREAALELGISTEACKKRVQRAKERLREAMGDEE